MSNALSAACVPATFNTLTVFGTEILNIATLLVTNFSASVPAGFRFTQPSIEVHNATFCNVTVTYTHPGQNDRVHGEAWLPVGNWNNRLQAVGGSGWAAGRSPLTYETMKGAIGDGYATITNDAGLTGDITGATDWALLSPGNIDLYKLNNLGSASLNEQAVMGKALVKSFYGEGPSFSYWNGCSQGGRQGFMLAQRYPTAFDGISAASPVLYFPEVLGSVQWPQQVMNSLGVYPHGCELDAITAAAVSECDGLDGVVDGIISDVDACLGIFDPFRLAGKVIGCLDDGPVTITHIAAVVVNATWKGVTTADGKQLWYGLSPAADLTGNDPSSGGLGGQAATNCSGETCTGTTNFLSAPWFQLFVAKNADFNINNLTTQEFVSMLRAGRQQYASLIATDDPDLSEFRDAGGKILSFHGLADQVVPPKGTAHYFRSVQALMPDVDSFYRHYEVPGLGHCFGGRSGNPTGLFEQLRAWVENGTAPGSSPVEVTGMDGKIQSRILCPYPERAQYSEGCGDAAAERCWSCITGKERNLGAIRD